MSMSHDDDHGGSQNHHDYRHLHDQQHNDSIVINTNNNNNKDRQMAELEFMTAAYSSDEAWWSTDPPNHDPQSVVVVVYRRLVLSEVPSASASSGGTIPSSTTCADTTLFGCMGWILKIHMPMGYPGNGESLIIQVTVDEEVTAPSVRKKAFQAVEGLLQVCRNAAKSCRGEEALFTVFSAADEWVRNQPYDRNDDTGGSVGDHQHNPRAQSGNQTESGSINNYNNVIWWGTKLIYSHHIISQTKRADMKQLAKEYHLTGFLKIGWPGIIIVEGQEEDCQHFYDTIKGWSWQYLVVRGETHDEIPNTGLVIDSARRFPPFQEVSDMAIVSNHCRQVGLEALFRTSMKIYDTNPDPSVLPYNDNNAGYQNSTYSALVHVDHMNDGKSYRKWLRRTCYEHGVSIFIQQFYPHDDYSKRPTILVGMIGGDVLGVLKHWRTRKVDVDARGKPCFERQMQVLVEGPLSRECTDAVDWEALANDDKELNTCTEKLTHLLLSVGGDLWLEAAMNIK